jgi:cytochrome d ubiquinol oxidase subunit II
VSTVDLILLFLGLSLLLYVLFGGADFGAGVLECFTGRRREKEREVISHAMAPVWEANHVWLILALVILFVGFPTVYTTISTYLFLPVTALLLGIVARGSAFAFRHYDTYDSRFTGVYSLIFAASSIWSSFFLGIIAGALMLGSIDPNATTFKGAYVAPWFNWFCLAVGAFTVALFALLAATYLVGECSSTELANTFRRKARHAATASIALGAVVFLAAEAVQFPLAKSFLGNGYSRTAFACATLLLVPFWYWLHQNDKHWHSRIAGAAIVSFVLLGWFAVQYPAALRMSSSSGISALSFYEVAAPDATLNSLLVALIAGSMLVFPALGLLLYIFKRETTAE